VYIGNLFDLPLPLFDSPDHLSTKPEQNLKSSKNVTHSSVFPSLPPYVHREAREANWASEQKATILVSIYSYRPYTHVVTNNGFIDLQTETKPGAVACLPFLFSLSLSLSLSLSVCCFSYCYNIGGSGVVT
jgi:hypothetical protein